MSKVAAIILAAGQSSRFRTKSDLATKLVAEYRGEKLVRRVAETALASNARPVVVVTGHARDEVEAAMAGLPVSLIHNAGYASGMAGSLQTGIHALPMGSTGALVMLADMPGISPATCDLLIAEFDKSPAKTEAIVPVWQGKPGNPVLMASAMFASVAALKGDQGARRLLTNNPAVRYLPVEDRFVLADIDTPESLVGFGQSV